MTHKEMVAWLRGFVDAEYVDWEPEYSKSMAEVADELDRLGRRGAGRRAAQGEALTNDVKPPVLEVAACGGCPALDPYYWGCKLWMVRNPGRLLSIEHHIYASPPDWCPLRPAGAVLRVKEGR